MSMFQGNWKCSKCGGAITELPFEPRSDNGLTCRDCYFKSKNGDTASSDNTGVSAADMDDRDAPIFDPDAGTMSEEQPRESGAAETGAPSGERKMFTGEWQCAGCGAAITQLPFEPRNTDNLKCLDCFKKSKG